MNNFRMRTVTGLSLVFLLLAAMAINFWLLAGFIFVILILGLREFYALFTASDVRPQKYAGTILGGLLYLAITIPAHIEFPLLRSHAWINTAILALPVFFLPFIFEIFRKKPNPLFNVAITLTGMIYLAVPFALINLFNGTGAIRFGGMPVIPAGFFIITWFYDTGAYLYGKRFGKYKFFERISPKKTWEGTITGALIALLTAVGFYFLIPSIELVHWLVIALLILVFGTSGDLIESLFKRSLNIKDSGTILPGHGGILDRFDTILISTPFVFLYLVSQNLI